MSYITDFERDAIVETSRESVFEILLGRFEVVPQQISDRLNAIKEPQKLKPLVRQAVAVASLEDFEQILAQPTAKNLPIKTNFPVPYMTDSERNAIRIGNLETARESVCEVLETRFEVVSQQMRYRLDTIKDITVLKQLHRQSILVASLEDFEQILAQTEAN